MYSLIRSLSKMFKTGVYDYTALEAPDGETGGHRFALKSGGFASYMRLHGAYEAIGSRGMAEALQTIIEKLEGPLKRSGFRIDIMFDHDPSAARQELQPSISMAQKTAKRLNLSASEILNERLELMSKKTAREVCLISVQTDIGCLPPGAIKEVMAERLQAVKGLGVGIKATEFGQSPFTAIAGLREIHNSLFDSVFRMLSEFGRVEKLDHHTTVRLLRTLIVPEATSPDWQPNLLGDRLPAKLKSISGHPMDASHLVNPEIAFQLFPVEPCIPSDDSSAVQIGERFYGPLSVEVPPEPQKAFSELFADIPLDMPWRFTLSIKTGHERVKGRVGNKKTIASLLALTSSVNKQIRDAADSLITLSEKSGYTLCETSMSFLTWGDTSKDLRRKKSSLMQSIQSWGGAEVYEEAGDPLQAVVCSLPSLALKPVANTYARALDDALSALPLQRPASPWRAGPMLFRSLDNKLYPMLESSSQQNTGVDIYYAPPGFGKSVMMAARNLNFLLRPQNQTIPRMAILDIGPSSEAFIALVRALLPAQQRHLAQAFTLYNESKYAVNVFDLPLGFDYPMATDRSFLVNFLSLLFTPAGQASISRLGELLVLLIDETYRYVSAANNPHMYSPGFSVDVDEALLRNNINYDEDTCWYEIRDALFAAGDSRAAIVAQRHAVPVISDLNSVLQNSRDIRQQFGEARTDTGESLISYLQSMVSAAITEYPILAQPTIFDIGNARVVSMNLMHVSPGGSPQMNKMTGLMYMLARQLLTREFYRRAEDFDNAPDMYRKYHLAEVERDAGTPRVVRYDEFHRTNACPQVAQQVVLDIREGRKFGVVIGLASQMLRDFTDDMVSLATNIFILGKGSDENSVNEIQERFGLNSDFAKGVRTHLGSGPGPEGSMLLYVGTIKDARTRAIQFLRLTVGPKELWAYSTTPEDSRLRDVLVSKVGLSKALSVLAEAFPGGSAKSYVESRAEKGDDAENIIEIVARELLERHQNAPKTGH